MKNLIQRINKYKKEIEIKSTNYEFAKECIFNVLKEIHNFSESDRDKYIREFYINNDSLLIITRSKVIAQELFLRKMLLNNCLNKRMTIKSLIIR